MAWLGTWANRIEITIDCDKVDDTLTHFAVALHLSASCGLSSYDATAVFDDLGANKLKIAVTQADGTTQMYVDIADWDEGAEEAWLWVSRAAWEISSSADTTIYLYYDSGQGDNTTYVSVSGDTAAQSVWRSEYKLVDHLNDGGSSSITVDSTSNNSDGTKKGVAEPVQGVGKVGKCQVFDGADDYVNYGQNFDYGNPASMSFWFKCNGDYINFQNPIARWHYVTSTSSAGEFVDFGITDYELRYRTLRNGSLTVTSSIALSSDAWHHVAVVHEASFYDMHIYYDGELNATLDAVSAAYSNVLIRATVGARYRYDLTSYDGFFNGSIDEARMLQWTTPAAWAKAEYNCGMDTFVTFESESGPLRVPRYGFTIFQDPGIV